MSGSSLAEVASVVIEYVRFPLLDPDTLNTIEKDNTKNYIIPVSVNNIQFVPVTITGNN